jgi:hypothetical protein
LADQRRPEYHCGRRIASLRPSSSRAISPLIRGQGGRIMVRGGGRDGDRGIVETTELPVTGVDLLTGIRYGTRLEVPAGEVRVLRQGSGG